MNRIFRILGIVLAVIVIAPLALLVVLALTFNPNDYKPQITETLTKQLGRQVTLAGDISYGLSWQQGLNLTVNKIALANPAWASRPVMADIGQAKLGLSLQALLQKKVQITGLALSQADIQLETSPAGQNNWDFKPEKGGAAQPVPADNKAPAKTATSLEIDQVTIADSQLAMRSRDGKTTVLTISTLTLTNAGQRLQVQFRGDYAGQAVALDLSGGDLQQVTITRWPFKATGRYGQFDLQASGSYEHAAQQVVLNDYAVTAGGSTLRGALTIGFGGARPALRGKLAADTLDPKDFTPKAVAAAEATQATAPQPAGEPQRLFSDQPLALDALKAADVKLDVTIGELTLPAASISQLQTKVDLTNGRLLLSPLTLLLAGSKVEGQFKLDASAQPAAFSTIMKAWQLDLGKFMPSFAAAALAIKADLDADLTGSGNSPRAMAGSLNGRLNMIVAGDAQTSRAASNFVHDMLEAALPGTGGLVNTDVNCMAARFVATDGILRTNGLLIDTSQATLAGQGDINLRDERLNMLMNIRTKAVDVSRYAPSLRITGPLLKPSLSPDRASVAGRLAGALLGGDVGKAIGGGANAVQVPEVIARAGQNACVATLDNPPPAAQAPAAQQPTGQKKPVDQLKNLGGQLLNNLLGQ